MGNGGSTSVLDTRLEDDVTDCEPVAKFSALMDPHVGEALANLLTQIGQPPNDLWAHFVRVSAEALETIILQKEGI
jgi:hypothetical protein